MHRKKKFLLIQNVKVEVYVDDTSHEMITTNQFGVKKQNKTKTITTTTTTTTTNKTIMWHLNWSGNSMMSIANIKINISQYSVKSEKLLSCTGEQIKLLIQTKNICIVIAINKDSLRCIPINLHYT